MKRASRTELQDELRPEYDMKELLKGGVRGKYVERYRAGTNLVLLEPDVAEVFPDEESVNAALRLVIELKKTGTARRSSPMSLRRPKHSVEGERVIAYRRKRGGDTWHWCSNCSLWPQTNFVEKASRPSGELCNECRAKQDAGGCVG